MASASHRHPKVAMTFLPSQSGQLQRSDLKRSCHLPWATPGSLWTTLYFKNQGKLFVRTLLQLRIELHHSAKRLLRMDRSKRSVFWPLWPARFGLGHLHLTAEKKMACDNSSVCLNACVDGAEYFAGHGSRETLVGEPSLTLFSWQNAKTRCRSLRQHLEWSYQHCIFLITQEDRKLIWPRNKVVIERDQTPCFLTLWHKTLSKQY